MKPTRILVLAPLVIIGFTIFIIIGGTLVTLLWNWLLPTLLGWPEITFLQALGVLALCRILFGGFSVSGPKRSKVRQRMIERWDSMTPEEREFCRQSWRERRGSLRPADSEPAS